jgi:hypothetical protein
VALEELAKDSCEFPAFSTLDDLATSVRAEVNGAVFALAYSRMSFDDHARLLGVLKVDPATGRSGHDRAKKSAPRATVTKLRLQLDHLAWLDGMAGASDAWLKGVPASKIAHFAAETRALDASEMRDYGEVKRIVLEACLLHQARVRARDDLVTMLCKRMNTMHNKARELAQTGHGRQGPAAGTLAAGDLDPDHPAPALVPAFRAAVGVGGQAGRPAGALPPGGLRLRLQPGRRPGRPAPGQSDQRARTVLHRAQARHTGQPEQGDRRRGQRLPVPGSAPVVGGRATRWPPTAPSTTSTSTI